MARYYGGEGGAVDRTMQCWNCGGIGHVSLQCRAPAEEKPCQVKSPPLPPRLSSLFCSVFADDMRHQLCGILGHLRRDCPQELCFRCGRPGHRAQRCNAATQARRDTFLFPLDQACFSCGRYGHVTRICAYSAPGLDQSLAPDKGNAPARKCCYNCGRSGHPGYQCTEADVNAWARLSREGTLPDVLSRSRSLSGGGGGRSPHSHHHSTGHDRAHGRHSHVAGTVEGRSGGGGGSSNDRRNTFGQGSRRGGGGGGGGGGGRGWVSGGSSQPQSRGWDSGSSRGGGGSRSSGGRGQSFGGVTKRGGGRGGSRPWERHIVYKR
jgi:Zinc knuckle